MVQAQRVIRFPVPNEPLDLLNERILKEPLRGSVGELDMQWVLQCENAPEHRAIAYREPEQRIYQDTQATLFLLCSGTKNAIETSAFEFLPGWPATGALLPANGERVPLRGSAGDATSQAPNDPSGRVTSWMSTDASPPIAPAMCDRDYSYSRACCRPIGATPDLHGLRRTTVAAGVTIETGPSVRVSVRRSSP